MWLADRYRGKRVLVTGHTGFKGAWLCDWLISLGAEVIGFALDPETQPNLYAALGLSNKLVDERGDLREPGPIEALIQRTAPDCVFHLAAQPLVRHSYREPIQTWQTNVMGTAHLLEAIRRQPSVQSCVVVTSDKCYENMGQVWGYRESDPMGGHDPYSSSKGAAELLVSSWRRSFFSEGHQCRLATARSGNVIGGGDWSKDRIISDFVRATAKNEPLALRSPRAIRPWQHVLEPLSGYLQLGAELLDPSLQRDQAWNFGPDPSHEICVHELISRLVESWGKGEVVVHGSRDAGNAKTPPSLHEAIELKLDCSKARADMQWFGIMSIERTLEFTASWYRRFELEEPASQLCSEQIDDYCRLAAERGLRWAS